ncbi:Extracellular matrix-binding ebh, putative [Babesia ovata]|uniref:Extracellular matrix-binding ebh, putative n=1 Tax=Babesia ovata TaxID=189622 RepID=A0A2H6K6Z0_9APIC|nr:Extracellular matrix-binding ebh, putative [Babesia ovata]GBE58738.1 Extracellular matrix-binding ebh, putative [Babesia ovata]
MDTSLKKDLKNVKDKIKEGIQRVIEDMNVLTLDEKVKGDLGTLKENISELANGMEGNDKHPLVESALSQLKEQKDKLNVLAGPNGSIKKETDGLQDKFENAIQQPLKTLTENVDKAIEVLGGNFKDGGGDGKKNLNDIFAHIQKKVGAIKGKAGRDSGLEGIVKKVQELTNAFVKGKGNNSGFNGRVGGWLEGVIGNGKGRPGTRDHKPGLQAVTSWLQQYKEAVTKKRYKESDFTDQVKNKIMQQTEISQAIAAAQGKIKQVVDGKVVDNLSAIVSACEEFVKELDKKITKTEIERFAPAIAKEIQSWASRQGLQNFNRDANLTTAVKYILVALCASVRQVGNEINSLGTDKFGNILDEIKPTVDALHTALEGATQIPTSPPASKNESPAKAVDSKDCAAILYDASSVRWERMWVLH